MDHHHMDEMMSKMYFHFGFGDVFLFEQLKIDSTIKMWAVCGLLFLLSIVYEHIKYIRCVQCGCQSNKSFSVDSTDGAQDHESNRRLDRACYVGRLRSKKHRLIQALLHVIQTSLGFLLMLSVMSFNLCIIFAIVVGSGVGYYTFYRPYSEVEAIDSCH